MVDQPKFEMYAFWRTSATFRVRVALNLKGLVAEERIVDLEKGEQRSEAFLKVNPMGAIPALIVDGGAPMTQSSAILEYLEEIAPSPALLPGDPLGRARVRSIVAMLAGDTHPLITPRVRKYLTAEAGFDDVKWKAWQVQWFGTGLRAVEARLAAEGETGSFCHGERVGMADICLCSITAVMKVFKVEIAGIPTVDGIVGRCMAMEAFAKADPYRQVGAPAV